jgi:carbonic anhydrase/acetyltransferase-like protein (isoleucine patch superfamily)
MHAIRFIDPPGAWIAANAVVCGDVELGAESSVWHHAVIRGDVAPIRVGRRVNVQDHALLHCHQGTPLDIADDVTIGHHAVVHCRLVGRGSLVGIRSVLLDGVEVGEGCIIAAGSVVTPGTRVPDHSVFVGTPARIVRQTTDRDREYIALTLRSYVELAQAHVAGRFADFAARKAT